MTLFDEVVRAFGLVDARGRALRGATDDAKAREASRRALRGALDGTRPRADAPSVGEALSALEAALATRTSRRVRRALAELSEVVSLAAYSRSKRAERARVLAAPLVVFELNVAFGIPPAAEVEETLRLLRREIDRRLAG